MKTNLKPDVKRELLALSHQIAIMVSEKPEIFAGCGVGSGKTFIGSSWILKKSNESPKDILGLIGANSYQQLLDSTLRRVYLQFQEWGVIVHPKERPRTAHPFSLKIWMGEAKGWQEILCRSLESYEKIAGVELGWAWLDEVWDTKEEAFKVIQQRVRDKRMPNPQTLYTTTLDDISSVIYKYFVENYNEKLMDVIYATTYANAHNLEPNYIDKLKSSLSKPEFQRMVLSMWVSLTGGLIYHAFDRNKHIKEVEIDPSLPLNFCFDFNISEGNPYSTCITQDKIGQDGRPDIRVVDEIVAETASTNEMIDEFEARGYNEHSAGVCIYGDATGRARDTRSKGSDYDIIKERGYRNIQVPLANPPIRSRHNAVNAVLCNAAGEVSVTIDPKCKTLATGLATTKYKSGFLEQETYHQHITTAFGYYIARKYPVKKISHDKIENKIISIRG